MKTLGEYLKELRGDLSISEAAAGMQISESTLSEYEEDRKRPGRLDMLCIASYFGVPVRISKGGKVFLCTIQDVK